MSGTSPILPQSGPTSSDVHRLFGMLKREFIPGLRIEVRTFEISSDKYGVILELVDTGAGGIDGSQWVNIWSSKHYVNQLHLISTAQLYDLLIVGYRQIEKYFEHGEAFAPARRQV